MDANELDFPAIYLELQPKIVRYLERLVGAAEAEDLAQEVFIKASQGLSGFRRESQLSTWLYRIATNAALDRLRRPDFQHVDWLSFPEDSTLGAEAELEERNAWTGEIPPTIEKQLVQKYMNECLLGFIARLPEDYRAALVLSELEEVSNKDIAEILGVSLDTVKIRLHRARARLREDLLNHCEYYWFEEPPW